jgi:integrase
MLIADAERYLSIRNALGFKLRNAARHFRAFAQFSVGRGDQHVRAATASAWAAAAPSPAARHVRMRDIARLARFLHAEDPRHEVPPNVFHMRLVRPLPYIYAPEEVARMLEAAGRLKATYPHRRAVYTAFFGLIAATGLRMSEARNLRLDDVSPEGVLRIRKAKFGKSRFVPMHPTTHAAICRYLVVRGRIATPDEHLFVSHAGKELSRRAVHETFRLVLRIAGILPIGRRPPRIHDLRHTFATRALQQCATRPGAASRHVVALATYLGHTNVADTYWYLEATPELMVDIAAAAEALIAGQGR